MPGSKYGEEQKAKALALYVEHGPREAARLTKIPQQTISRWAKAAGVRTEHTARTNAATEAATAERERSREDLRRRMLDRAHELLDWMNEPQVDFKGQQAERVVYDRPPAQDQKALATAMAILLDKFRLEMGEATGRTETVTQSEFDREVSELIEKLKEQSGDTEVASHGNGKPD